MEARIFEARRARGWRPAPTANGQGSSVAPPALP
jgi:hypothetical protein